MALCPSVGRGSYPLAPSFPPSSSQGGQVPEPGFPSLNKKMDVWQTQCVRPAANPCGQVAAVVWACGQVFDLSTCPYSGASCPSSRVLWAFALVSFGVVGYGGGKFCINVHQWHFCGARCSLRKGTRLRESGRKRRRSRSGACPI